MENVFERLGYQAPGLLHHQGEISVWKAFYQEQPVVLKMLSWGNDYDLLNSWLDEVLVQHQLDHPNISKVRRICACELGHFIVMEQMQCDLAAYLSSQRASLKEGDLWLLLREMTAALSYAQSKVIAT
jgi:hypothetical protein